MTLFEEVQGMYRLLADSRIEKSGLFDTGNGRITTPLADDTLSLFTYKSKRPDGLIEKPVIENIVAAIKAGGGFKGINHIGFCYKVASKEEEVKRITHQAGGQGFQVYQEPSSDGAEWIFVGDISEITNPLLEFLPHEGDSGDRWVDYWLPHIQFDIDTGMAPDEIEALVKKFISRPYTPYPIQIKGVTYIQRINLGCLEGVNLMLDLSTNNRDINHRRNWKKLT